MMAFDNTHVDRLLQEGWNGRLHNIAQSRKLTEQALEIARAHTYTLGILRGLRNLAAVHNASHDYNQSLALVMEALALLGETQASPTDAFDLYLLAAAAYLRLGDMPESLAYCYKAEDIAVNIADKTRQADVYRTIGNSYLMIENYPQAVAYYTQARKVLQVIGDIEGEVTILNNLCHCCHHSGELEDALVYGQLGLELYKQIETAGGQIRRVYGYNLNNVGVAYLKSGRFDEAAPFFAEALKVFEQDIDLYGAIYSWRGLGQINLHNKQYAVALTQLNQALTLAQQSNIVAELKTTHHVLAEAYKEMVEPEKALEHFEQFYLFEKMMFNDEIERKIRNLEAAHRIQQAQKEAEIYQLRTVALQNEVDERRKVEEELRKRTAQLEGLRHMSLELTAELELDTLLNSIVIRARELLKGDSGLLYLYRPELGALELTIRQGKSHIPLETRLKPDEGLSGKVWQQRRAIVQTDYWQWAGRISGLDVDASTAIVAVPIEWGGEFLGVLNVAVHDRKVEFAEDVELLEMFAVQTAVAIHNAQLHEQIQSHAHEMERRVAERTRELLAANERLQEIDTLKSKLIDHVSHELRTPVTNIGLYLDLMERGSVEKRQHYTHVLHTQKNRLAALIEGIITISRLHKLPLNLTQVNINNLIEQLLEKYQDIIHNKGLSLSFMPQASLPLINGDAEQLVVVFSKILDNAVNYTDTGGIQIVTTVQDEYACVQITDTGIGIPANEIPSLFDHFYRSKQVAQLNIPGIGLGLTIAKEIITFHGGSISVKSVLGKGATFSITLPLLVTTK
ncbi:MAG: tetratricopeptide repeat protein [Ardenticatenaceae bacterium]|nr:tetratricopeptide repeat protein [Ardenticatenaceae bacterium]